MPGIEAQRLLVDREGCVVGARRHERSRLRGETRGGLGLPDDGTRSGLRRLDPRRRGRDACANGRRRSLHFDGGRARRRDVEDARVRGRLRTGIRIGIGRLHGVIVDPLALIDVRRDGQTARLRAVPDWPEDNPPGHLRPSVQEEKEGDRGEQGRHDAFLEYERKVGVGSEFVLEDERPARIALPHPGFDVQRVALRGVQVRGRQCHVVPEQRDPRMPLCYDDGRMRDEGEAERVGTREGHHLPGPRGQGDDLLGIREE